MDPKQRTLFSGYNYYLLLLACSLILFGFLLMTGNSGGDAFEKIFNFRRITLAPVVILTGYTLIIPAIMWNRKSEQNGKPRNGKI